MINYFYSNLIAERIKTLLDENLSDSAAKNITVGDFSVLPSPDSLEAYLPAVLITVDSAENQPANESMRVYSTPYRFSLYYLYPYTSDGYAIAVTKGKQYAEAVANVLMRYHTLDGFSVPKSETEAGGVVVSAELSQIQYESAEEEFFRNLYIPMQIAQLVFTVQFRTYRR